MFSVSWDRHKVSQRALSDCPFKNMASWTREISKFPVFPADSEFEAGKPQQNKCHKDEINTVGEEVPVGAIWAICSVHTKWLAFYPFKIQYTQLVLPNHRRSSSVQTDCLGTLIVFRYCSQVLCPPAPIRPPQPQTSNAHKETKLRVHTTNTKPTTATRTRARTTTLETTRQRRSGNREILQ